MRATELGAAAVLLVVAACAPPASGPAPLPLLDRQVSGTTALLQAVSAPSSDTVWVSGHRGTWARTTDGGHTWQLGTVPGADSLQFRDVHAASADTAWLLSAGNGPMSRIYRTTDGGVSWDQQFINRDSSAFYDCFDFWDPRRGVAYSDQVNGRSMILLTENGGEEWKLVDQGRAPAALPGEGAFAASGTCVITRPGGHGWIGTGNGPESRVLHTSDYGKSWSVSEAPIAAGEAAGIASVAFMSSKIGAVLGGPIAHPDSVTDNVALTTDGGRKWIKGGRPTFPGAVFGAAFVPGSEATLVAVGPRGASASRDGGRSWVPVDTVSYWGIGFAPDGTGWMVGPGGRITRIGVR